MSFWMWTIRNLISFARGTYNARKFWTHRPCGSVRWRTIAWKYAHKNFVLQSGSPTRLVVMNARSSARDRSLRIDYWTLNSCNVNYVCGKWVAYGETVTYSYFHGKGSLHIKLFTDLYCMLLYLHVSNTLSLLGLRKTFSV